MIITVRVENEDGTPVKNAIVQVDAVTVAAADGVAKMDVPQGKHTRRVVAQGYRSLQCEIDIEKDGQEFVVTLRGW